MLQINNWSEKYRPTKMADAVLPARLKSYGEQLIASGQINHMILSGPAGGGKTTFAKVVLEELDYEYIMINGSLEGRLIDTIRSTITQFVTTKSMGKRKKAIIFDEADHAPADTVQTALRGFIEQYGKNCVFIFTCNYENRLIEPLKSRCPPVSFNYSNEEKAEMIPRFFARLGDILDKEGVAHDKKTIGAIAIKLFPDFRKTLNTLQRIAVITSNNINPTSYGMIDSLDGDMNNLITHLTNKNFKGVREWVATTPNADMAFVSRTIYDKLYDICATQKHAIPEIVLIIAKYQFQHAFAADKEINTVAMLTEIMSVL